MSLAETFWVDGSEHNGNPVNDRYLDWPKFSGWFSFRSNDGTYKDELFPQNFSWVQHCSRLVGFIVYLVFPASASEVSWGQTLSTFLSQIGNLHHPRMVVMIDVESWSGHVSGNHSSDISGLRRSIAAHLFNLRPAYQRKVFGVWFRRRDLQRVVLYGNAGDLRSIVPNRDGARVLLANYGPDHEVPFPGKFAQQFTSSAVGVPPWPGKVDVNYAPVSPQKLARQLGLGIVRWSAK